MSNVGVHGELTGSVTRMQLWNKKAKGTLIVVLINGILGIISAQLASLVYRKWGWSFFATMAVILLVLLFSLSPVTSRILRASNSGSSDQSKSSDAGKYK